MRIFSPKIALAAGLMLGALTWVASSASAMPAADPSVAVVTGTTDNIQQVHWRRHYGYHYYRPYYRHHYYHPYYRHHYYHRRYW